MEKSLKEDGFPRFRHLCGRQQAGSCYTVVMATPVQHTQQLQHSQEQSYTWACSTSLSVTDLYTKGLTGPSAERSAGAGEGTHLL